MAEAGRFNKTFVEHMNFMAKGPLYEVLEAEDRIEAARRDLTSQLLDGEKDYSTQARPHIHTRGSDKSCLICNEEEFNATR